MHKMEKICYLCGNPIAKKDKSRDHVPPQDFFPSRLRQKYNPSRLKTLLTHYECNRSYQEDEDYFRFSIGAADRSNIVLRELWYDMQKTVLNPKSRRFRRMIFKEYEEYTTSAGLFIPKRIAKRFDSNRVQRVVWKIVRGWFYIEFKRIVPEFINHRVTYFHSKHVELNTKENIKIYNMVKYKRTRGIYKSIFAYKFDIIQSRNIAVIIWAPLFWNRFLFLVVHHDPDCGCNKCKSR